MRKIKIAYITKDLSINGISTVIMNYCRNIDREKNKITIFSGSPVDKIYEDECKKIDIKIEKMPPKRGANPIKYYYFLLKKLSKKEFDIVHVHGNSATITIEIFIAFLKGIKVRIAHCHNTTCDNIKIHNLLQPFLKKLYTHGFACSKEAGEWMLGNSSFEVLPNGFETKKFIFNEKSRKKIRKKLNIEGKTVIGHVGMFNDQKNHPFILKVFEEIGNKNKNAILLLVGTGPNYDKIQEIIKNHPYQDRIICYGVTNNVSEVYDAMDLFFFPSKYEGLGIVLLEAQIKGLPCIASDVVPREVTINESSIKYISLGESLKYWSDNILEFYGNKPENRKKFYEENKEEIEKYDIKDNAKMLSDVYCDLTANKR